MKRGNNGRLYDISLVHAAKRVCNPDCIDRRGVRCHIFYSEGDGGGNEMTTFYGGLLIGIFIGTFLGILIMGILAMSRDDEFEFDDEMRRGDGNG